MQIKKIAEALKESSVFLGRYLFEDVPSDVPDNFLRRCCFCGKKAWLMEDIQHKRNCELGQTLKLIKSAAQQVTGA